MRTDITMKTLAERYLALGAAVINGGEKTFEVSFDVREPPQQPLVLSNSDEFSKFLIAAFTIAQRVIHEH